MKQKIQGLPTVFCNGLDISIQYIQTICASSLKYKFELNTNKKQHKRFKESLIETRRRDIKSKYGEIIIWKNIN